MTWLMIFVFYTGTTLQSLSLPYTDATSCVKALDNEYRTQMKAGIKQQHMIGWCVDTQIETLEMKPSVETKPEFLR